MEARLFDDDYDEYNCGYFETWKEAQKVFESAGGVENDVYRLDRDGDGIACEAFHLETEFPSKFQSDFQTIQITPQGHTFPVVSLRSTPPQGTTFSRDLIYY